jgi:CheY-like chemotaxis protein
MYRLLIIDDDQSIRKLLRCIFEKLGHEVNEAENGEEGFSRYLIQPADIVITDLFMPQREGLGTTLKLRRLENPPEVIVITGAGRWYREAYLETAKKLGALTVLIKPFTPKTIVAAVQAGLQKKWNPFPH